MLFSRLKQWLTDQLAKAFHTPRGIDLLIRESELKIINLTSIIKERLDDHDGQGRYERWLWAERLRRQDLLKIRDQQRRSITQPIL